MYASHVIACILGRVNAPVCLVSLQEALKAYQRDLEADVGLPYQKSAQNAILEREIEKEKMKKMIEDQLRQQEEAKEAEKKTGKRKSSATKEAEPVIVTQPKVWLAYQAVGACLLVWIYVHVCIGGDHRDQLSHPLLHHLGNN